MPPWHGTAPQRRAVWLRGTSWNRSAPCHGAWASALLPGQPWRIAMAGASGASGASGQPSHNGNPYNGPMGQWA